MLLIISHLAYVRHGQTCHDGFSRSELFVFGVQQRRSFPSSGRDDDDDDPRVKLCSADVGRGQRSRPPTVPVSQLPKACRGNDRVTSGLDGTPWRRASGGGGQNQSGPVRAAQLQLAAANGQRGMEKQKSFHFHRYCHYFF